MVASEEVAAVTSVAVQNCLEESDYDALIDLIYDSDQEAALRASSMDVLALLCRHLSTVAEKDAAWSTVKSLVKRVQTFCKPKEALLVFLEILEEIAYNKESYTPDTYGYFSFLLARLGPCVGTRDRFCTVLDLLSAQVDRLPAPAIPLEIPVKECLLLLDNATEMDSCVELLQLMTRFLRPFASQYPDAMRAFLLSLTKHPLGSVVRADVTPELLSLHSKGGIARSYYSLVMTVLKSLQLISTDFVTCPLLEYGPVEVSISCAAMFYLCLTFGHIPQVYTRAYVFDQVVECLAPLLTDCERSTAQGLTTLQYFLSDRSFRLRPSCLSYAKYRMFFQHFVEALTLYESEALRREGASVFRDIYCRLSKQDRLLLIRFVFYDRRTLTSNSVLGYLVDLYRSDLHVELTNEECLRSAGDDVKKDRYFQENLAVILPILCALPEEADSDIVPHLDQCMACISLLRYIVNANVNVDPEKQGDVPTRDNVVCDDYCSLARAMRCFVLKRFTSRVQRAVSVTAKQRDSEEKCDVHSMEMSNENGDEKMNQAALAKLDLLSDMLSIVTEIYELL